MNTNIADTNIVDTSSIDIDTTNIIDVGDACIKIIVVGDRSVGKTSILIKSLHNIFRPNEEATIGCDFHLKLPSPIIRENVRITPRLQFWDIGDFELSQEHLFSMRLRTYLKDSLGAIVVVDVTRKNTFDTALKYIQKISAHACIYDEVTETNVKIPIILCFNKVDLVTHDKECIADVYNLTHGEKKRIEEQCNVLKNLDEDIKDFIKLCNEFIEGVIGRH